MKWNWRWHALQKVIQPWATQLTGWWLTRGRGWISVYSIISINVKHNQLAEGTGWLDKVSSTTFNKRHIKWHLRVQRISVVWTLPSPWDWLLLRSIKWGKLVWTQMSELVHLCDLPGVQLSNTTTQGVRFITYLCLTSVYDPWDCCRRVAV